MIFGCGFMIHVYYNIFFKKVYTNFNISQEDYYV